jgi:hypothetical protein
MIKKKTFNVTEHEVEPTWSPRAEKLHRIADDRNDDGGIFGDATLSPWHPPSHDPTKNMVRVPKVHFPTLQYEVEARI